MIPWKRTLGWTLCWIVASAAVTAEEPGADAMLGVDDGATATAEAASAPADTVDPAQAQAALEDGALAGEADLLAGSSDPDASDVMEDLPVEAVQVEPTPVAPAPSGVVAWDSEGREGRIHTVVRGDTLWHISDAYLGTPWVWPSIWNDNGNIKNPHVIHPGDHIWITATEMRRLTAEEAEQMLSNRPVEEPIAMPAAIEEPPAAMEDAIPGIEVAPLPAQLRSVRVSARETTGLISPKMYESAASVVDRDVERIMMSQEDDLYIGLGEGEVQVGDEFTLFRTNQKVIDPDTRALLGYHVDFLGWIRVEATFPETSRASIRMSTGEIEVGDRVIPRVVLPDEIEVRPGADGVEGKITFFPGQRVLLGFADFVYLNRGTLDGIEVGSPLEVYRQSYPAKETARDEYVAVPDRVIAKMLVVRAEEQTSVALVTEADQELELGDRFRGEAP